MECYDHMGQDQDKCGYCELISEHDREIARLTAERDQARAGEVAAYERAAKEARPVGLRGGNDYSTQFHQCADRIRALATEPGTTALAEIVKKAVDAETQACADVTAFMPGSRKMKPILTPWRKAILARIDQRKEAGE